jgi:hypothetical protein
MTGFHRASLLELVAQGEDQSQLERAVLLLRVARPELNLDTAWDWPVGDRDRAIWETWRQHHRGALEAVSACPDCGDQLEYVLPEDFAPPPAVIDQASIRFEGREYIVRLPTSRDLLAAQRGELNLLLGGESMNIIPQHLFEEALEAADPGLDVAFAHTCPSCAAQWKQSFDVSRFVWQDCVQRAERLLLDVDTIARTYGWSEHEILDLSEQRRLRYVAMIREQAAGNIQRLHAGRQRLA